MIQCCYSHPGINASALTCQGRLNCFQLIPGISQVFRSLVIVILEISKALHFPYDVWEVVNCGE